jgi:hypothetical protein
VRYVNACSGLPRPIRAIFVASHVLRRTCAAWVLSSRGDHASVIAAEIVQVGMLLKPSLSSSVCDGCIAVDAYVLVAKFAGSEWLRGWMVDDVLQIHPMMLIMALHAHAHDHDQTSRLWLLTPQIVKLVHPYPRRRSEMVGCHGRKSTDRDRLTKNAGTGNPNDTVLDLLTVGLCI